MYQHEYHSMCIIARLSNAFVSVAFELGCIVFFPLQLSAENENLRGKLGNCLKSCEDCRRLLQVQENQNLALEAQIEELKTVSRLLCSLHFQYSLGLA